MHRYGGPDFQVAHAEAAPQSRNGILVGVGSVIGALDGDGRRMSVQNQNVEAFARIAASGKEARPFRQNEIRHRSPARRRIAQGITEREIENLFY